MAGGATWLEPQVIAAIASAIAATAAAVATWRGPITAARMAEELRQRSESESEKRRFRLNVFASLMQERAEIYSSDAVRALNSIDIAFADIVSVREAWSELYQVLHSKTTVDAHVIDERLRKLLREMAIELGIADTLRLDDFARVYFPNAMADESRLRELQRKTHLAQLTGQNVEEVSEQTPLADKWPPKPSS